MSNTTISEALEAARAEKIQHNLEHSNEACKQLSAEVDKLIFYLQCNRQHLGGFIFVANALEGDACANPEDGTAADGRAEMCAISDVYGASLRERARKMFSRSLGNGLLGGLEGLFD